MNGLSGVFAAGLAVAIFCSSGAQGVVAQDASAPCLPLGDGGVGLTSISTSGSSSFDVPGAVGKRAVTPGMGGDRAAERRSIKPFSSLAIGVEAGLPGVVVELATPLNRRMNLRGGGGFLSFNPKLVEDGIDLLGDIELRSGFVTVDLFPFNGSFRISPGFALYNGDHLIATAMVPGGQTFDLGDATYTSSTSDPVHGTFDLTFGRRTAPRLTIGWGNMIPRNGGHWSFPFELGAEYIGQPPVVALALAGTVCQGRGTCTQIQSDPTTQQNVKIEQNEINNDIPSWLRFFPIVSTGVSFRFGHGGAER